MDSEFSRKKVLIFGALLFVVLAIPVTVYTALHQQRSNTKAAVVPEDTVIVIINGTSYTKADIRKVAEEQYAPAAVDQQALTDALATLEERKILDAAAASLGITADPNRANKYKLQGLSDTDANYQALREQVTLKTVNSREAESVGFWNTPAADISSLDVTEQSSAASQLAVGIPALTTAETRMKAGDSPTEVADVILASSPELAPVLGVNGVLYAPADADGKTQASYPQIFEFGDTNLGTQTRDAVFAQDEGAVVKVTDTADNRGGAVFRIKTKGNVNGAATYSDWFTSQKSALVQDVNSL